MRWRAVCLVLLLAPPAIADPEAQRSRRGATSPVHPVCADADPASFDRVYACLEWADGNSRYPFAGSIATSDCRSIGLRYAALLQQTAGLSRQQAVARTPSCEIFARAAEKMKGKPAYWAACLGFGQTSAEVHVKACVEGYIAAYHGSRGAVMSSVQDCAQVYASYEQGLRRAHAKQQLPAGYVRPGCDLAERLVDEWSQRTKVQAEIAE